MVELYRNSSKLRGRVGDILDKVLQKRYPKEVMDRNELDFGELIEWELWPTYITVYSNIQCTSK